MIQNLSITVLVDNISHSDNLLCEHGLSLWIEADERRILFDTGQSDVLIRNADVLGIDLRTVDTLVLSHGHYDHIGGVAAVLDLNPDVSIFCHPGIFMPRYSRQSDGKMKPIGITKQALFALQKVVDTIHWTSGPIFVSPDIGITGPIPRLSNFEDTGGAFFLDPEATKQDSIDDDLAMWLSTVKGIVNVTGCCHSGIVNTLTYIMKLADKIQMHSVLGGFHLLNASQDRLDKTRSFLSEIRMNNIMPCHCSGQKAISAIWSSNSLSHHLVSTGSIFNIS